MRYILTPMSAMTWANLNHTLCGIDNDPWRATFGMREYFYYWADYYLLFTSVSVSKINSFIASFIATDPIAERVVVVVTTEQGNDKTKKE